MDIVLASASPRRSQLLRDLGIKDIRIVPSLSEEAPPPTASPREAVEHIALSKASDVYDRVGSESLIIAADTLVYLDGVPLGKPADEDEAVHMLKALSGREHTVVTGIAVIKGGDRVTASEETLVRFRPMTDDEIRWYVSTGEPMDKAGAYGAQGRGSVFIERIEGDFFNVMGLPMCRLISTLGGMGISLRDLVPGT